MPPADPPFGLLRQELALAKHLAHQAGYLLLAMQRANDYRVEMKAGDAQAPATPVTSADLAANELICSQLHHDYPLDGILSEEGYEHVDPRLLPWWQAHRAWIIDPLDGTKGFIQGSGEYGVHIGMTIQGIPALGVNYYPALKTTYWGIKGGGAFKQTDLHGPVRLRSSHALSDTLDPLGNSDQSNRPFYEKVFQRTIAHDEYQTFRYLRSCGLRLCAIAQGEGNLYVSRATGGGLWDTLSGEVILQEAGGTLWDWHGQPLNYRNPDPKLSKGLVACGTPRICKHVIRCLAEA